MKYTITTIIIALAQFGVISALLHFGLITSVDNDIDPLSFLLGNLQIIAVFVALHLADKHCRVA